MIEEPTSGPAAAGPVRRSIWPAMHPRLLDLVQEHRSTLIFVNARRLAERLATRLNELASEREIGEEAPFVSAEQTTFVGAEGFGAPPAVELVKAHHGSLSRERRLMIEDELKSGRLKGLVATSSLELGIDMGAVDLVIQVESPGAVARGLQRIGRAGHQVGEPSRGRLFPKHRADLVEAAVVVDRMHKGLIEHTRYPRNPLDVLAQQIVAMVALDDWKVDELAALVRRAANFEAITDEVLASVLDLLSGRYPSDEFAELRPRIVWDRVEGTVRGRAGSQRLAVTSGGTIPDRGLFGVFLPDGTRVGELDEEMVYESRVGETFLLGASTWRIEDITHERVVVTPAPGQPGKMPFWHGDGPGRPLELGRAVGEFVRTIRTLPADQALARLRDTHDLDEAAARNLLEYLDEQMESGGALPDDRTIVVERFRDEIGDWRVCVLSPFGAQVHAPWAMALQARLSERWGIEVELMWSDDGIVIRLPEAIDELPLDELVIDPDEVDDIVVSRLPSTAMFASRFRECAARALLLPRRRPDRRTPLWQQRQKAADLLTVAAKYPSFPILLEATRECVNDVFDLPALKEVQRDLRSRKVRLVAVDTPRASPFAQSLLFGWIAVYMYEGDAPLAERRAAALALDRDLLRELLGAEELRELIDGDVLATLELELQRLVDNRRARDPDELHDVLRDLGPLTVTDLDVRSTDGADVVAWIDQLVAERRAIRVAVAGEDRVAAAEDAAKLRDALGCSLPLGLPTAFTDPVDDPLLDLVARFARTHGPFLAHQAAAGLGADQARVRESLERLEVDGRIVRGEFRPDGVEREWCDDDVLRQLRRRSLAALRREVEPVDAEALARFLPAWQAIERPRSGSTDWPRCSGSSRARRSRRRCSRPTCCPLACAATGRSTSMRSPPRASWCGWGPAPSVPPTAGSASSSATRSACCSPPTTAGSRSPARCTWPCGSTSPRVARPSGRSWCGPLRRRARRPPTRCCSTRSGISCGRARSPTTRSLRCGPASPARLARAVVAVRPAARTSTACPGSGRPPVPAVGRWWRRSASRCPRPPRRPTPARCNCSSATACSPARPRWVRGPKAGSPASTRCSRRSRSRAGCGVGTSWPASVPPSSRSPARSTTCGRLDRGRADAEDEPTGPVVLAATDPAQPYGAAIPWPDSAGRPPRAAGAHVVLADGHPVAFLERGGRSVVTFPAAADHPDWVDSLVAMVKDGRRRSIEITRADGEPVRDTPVADMLRRAGFVEGYRGLVYRERPSR